jgi:cytochrome b6-f complex iron-sulfur subunit
MSELNRREFVVATGIVAAGCACAFCCADALAAPGDKPSAGAGGAHATGGKVDIGKLSDYSSDGITDKFARTNRFFIVRTDGKIFACSARCTHKFSPLKIKDDHFACPSHGSQFSIQGTVTHGPAKSSLERYAISRNDAGNLIVDTSSAFREKDWDKPESFIDVKA